MTRSRGALPLVWTPPGQASMPPPHDRLVPVLGAEVRQYLCDMLPAVLLLTRPAQTELSRSSASAGRDPASPLRCAEHPHLGSKEVSLLLGCWGLPLLSLSAPSC